MRSLQRDLFERRLWPLAIVLVVAIVAVPLLLHSHRARAAVAPPAPAATGKSVAPAKAAGHHASTSAHHRKVPTSTTRSPFATADVTAAGGTSTNSMTSTTATTSSSSPSPAAAVSSSATDGSSTSDSSTPATTATPTATTPVVTTPVTTTPVTTTPVTTPATKTSTKVHVTLYSVGLRIGAAGHPSTHRNIALYTPLPSERDPQLMFMGTTDHERDAVFATGAAVGLFRRSGRRSDGASCHPTDKDCALIAVPAGRSVGLGYVSSDGVTRTLILRLTGISSRAITSPSAIKAALARHSAVGLCDLELGDPLSFYDPLNGTMTMPSAKSCRRDSMAVPFPGSLGAGTSERG